MLHQKYLLVGLLLNESYSQKTITSKIQQEKHQICCEYVKVNGKKVMLFVITLLFSLFTLSVNDTWRHASVLPVLIERIQQIIYCHQFFN